MQNSSSRANKEGGQSADTPSETEKQINQDFENHLFYLIGRYQIKHLDTLDIVRKINSDRVFEKQPLNGKTIAPNKIDKPKNFDYDFFKLVGEYNLNHQEVIAIARNSYHWISRRKNYIAKTPKKTRRFINPHTGAIIATKEGTPHKLLRIWKNQYGFDEVESWLYDEY